MVCSDHCSIGLGQGHKQVWSRCSQLCQSLGVLRLVFGSIGSVWDYPLEKDFSQGSILLYVPRKKSSKWPSFSKARVDRLCLVA